MLLLEESGTVTSIAEPYFESSRCAYLDNYDEVSAVSLNLTLVDMGGVFLVLSIFVGVSLLSWVCRRSPPAKAFWRGYYARRKERRASEKVLKVCSRRSYTRYHYLDHGFDMLDSDLPLCGMLRRICTVPIHPTGNTGYVGHAD